MDYRSIIVAEIFVIAIAYWAQNGQLGLFYGAAVGTRKLIPQ